MSALITTYGKLHQQLFRRLRHLDGLPPLLLRLYLAPVMIAVGLHNFATGTTWSPGSAIRTGALGCRPRR